uniref:Uncharacterized protein n=1 Tax=Panagrolaimus sp. PS1159 TaxID=55785 RepID=A0AC35FYY1_9BILA
MLEAFDRQYLAASQMDDQLEAAARPSYGSQNLKNWLRERWICRCNEPFIPPNPQHLLAFYRTVQEFVLLHPNFLNHVCNRCQCLDSNAILAAIQ